ncbi:PAP2 superfamily protein [Abditibacterium utsteinense]|uniref:PAP2 superfamily protein n=1 Tax=Abditibacterium utsteinense TaxID=1960156 RepID=A0A2S8SVE0_9BACT|nr:phosphatase PAP2 family protein [Abditibacterium utsteinense]PQV64760.1 PAP2 superfamily protein [Abditibacterium utsteinense]
MKTADLTPIISDNNWMHKISTPVALLATLIAMAGNFSGARADSLDQFGLHKARGEAKFASGTGNTLFLAAGTLLPLLNGKQGEQQTVRTLDALLIAVPATEVLKTLTHERRPDDSSSSSFPSGHASAAFTVATMQAHYHPKQALLWYGGATIIAASRVQLERHYWHDVIAGAALGYFSAQFELKSPRGLILRPLIHREERQTNAGFELGWHRVF